MINVLFSKTQIQAKRYTVQVKRQRITVELNQPCSRSKHNRTNQRTVHMRSPKNYKVHFPRLNILQETNDVKIKSVKTTILSKNIQCNLYLHA